MEVYFTPEQETQLAQLATKAGTDAKQLVKDAILRLIKDEISFRRPAPELPAWDLGAIGSMHCRDNPARFEAALRGRRHHRHNRLTLFSSRPGRSRRRR